MAEQLSMDTTAAQRDQPPMYRNPGDAIGGFTADTEVMTTDGPVEVSDLESGRQVYALNPMTGMLKRKQLTDITLRSNTTELVQLTGRGLNLRVHPEHPILYRTKSIREPRFVRAGWFAEREHYRFIGEWYPPRGTRLDVIDITDHLATFQARVTTDSHGHTFRTMLPDGCEPSYVNSHSGYHFDATTFKQYQSEIEDIADEVSVREGLNQRTQPYRFDGDDFIELIGWFVTEGSIYWREGKRTAEIQIAQDTPRHRQRIRSLFDRLGISVSVSSKQFKFGSILFGSLLESMCGKDSRTKRLPQFVWQLSAQQKRLLLNTLLAGDGNANGTYYTVSERLASDVLRLALELGYKPRYTRRKSGCWRVYLSRGNNCFRSSKACSTVASQIPLYQLSIEDFNAIIAGRDGRFQWVGTSGVT